MNPKLEEMRREFIQRARSDKYLQEAMRLEPEIERTISTAVNYRPYEGYNRITTYLDLKRTAQYYVGWLCSNPRLKTQEHYRAVMRAIDELLPADAVDLADFEADARNHDPINVLQMPRVSAGPSTRFKILKRDGYRCQLCGATAAEGARLEVDHRIPRARGGTDAPENLWTLCWDCNRGKSDELLH